MQFKARRSSSTVSSLLVGWLLGGQKRTLEGFRTTSSLGDRSGENNNNNNNNNNHHPSPTNSWAALFG